MTVLIQVDSSIEESILVAPPIVRKFIGQPLSNLMKWMMKQRNFKFCKVPK